MFIYERFKALMIGLLLIATGIFFIATIITRDFNKFLWKMFLCALAAFILNDPKVLFEFMEVIKNLLTDIFQGGKILSPDATETTTNGTMEL